MNTIEKTAGAVIIHFNGDMTIEQASEAKAITATTLAESNSVLIDTEQIQNADLSFFQVICSAHRTALKTRKSLDVTGTVPELFKKKLHETGFHKARTCGFFAPQDCLCGKMGR